MNKSFVAKGGEWIHKRSRANLLLPKEVVNRRFADGEQHILAVARIIRRAALKARIASQEAHNHKECLLLQRINSTFEFWSQPQIISSVFVLSYLASLLPSFLPSYVLHISM